MRKFSLLAVALFASLVLTPSLVLSDTVEIIIEYEPAPNLDVDITAYPTSAVDPSTAITLTSSVTNIGSDDATSTWLAWELPSGWTITSGSSNVSLGTLSTSQSGQNSITANVGSSIGTFTVTARAGCAEGASGYDSKSVGIGEEPTTTTSTTTTVPSEPGAPSSPGGGIDGGVLPPVTPDLSYTYSIEYEEFEVYHTIADNNVLRIENTGPVELTGVKVSLIGMPKEWYTIERGEFDSILPGESRRVDITFHPPAGETGTFFYEVNITSNEDTVFVGGTLIVKELTPQAEKELETKKSEEQQVEEAKRTINIVSVLLVVFGVLGPAIIAIYMLTFLLRKRCPLCGTRMNVDYKGKNFTTYRCPTCHYFHTEEKGAKKKKNEEVKEGGR
jgi:hypothetical protein